MKKKLTSILSIAAISFAALTFSACSGAPNHIYVEPHPSPAPATFDGSNLPKETCFFQDIPSDDVLYTVLKNFKAAKGIYGSISEVIPHATTKIKQLGGNAAINFLAWQKGSIFPWRFVSPYATGTAIFIFNTNGKSCTEMGGMTADAFN